jgi:hypothetical protein
MFAYVWETFDPEQPETMVNMKFAVTFRTPSVEAASAIPIVAAMPDGRRSILISSHVAKAQGPAGYDTQAMFDLTLDTGLATIVKGTVWTTDTINWITDYVAALIAGDITSIDRLILDTEFGIGFDSLTQAQRETQFQALWDDATAQAMLSQSLRDYVEANRGGVGQEGLVFSTGGSTGETTSGTARSEWNSYFAQLGSQWKETAFADTFKSQIGLPDLLFSDYNHIDRSFLAYNSFGIPYDSIGIGQTSPDMYQRTQDVRFTSGTKHVLWRWFVDAVVRSRSIIGSGATLTPWLHAPSLAATNSSTYNANPWAWRQYVLHLAYMGVTDVLGFWLQGTVYASPGSASYEADMQYANDTILLANEITPVGFLKHDTDLDADEVVTGRFRTTYTDFLANGV